MFDGRYFIWRTDQCRLFTCATCIAGCLFANTEKYTRRSGKSTYWNRREIENQVWSRFSFMPFLYCYYWSNISSELLNKRKTEHNIFKITRMCQHVICNQLTYTAQNLYYIAEIQIFTMVLYVPHLNHLKIFDFFFWMNEQSTNTSAVRESHIQWFTWNQVKCPLLQEIRIYYFSLKTVERSNLHWNHC